MNFNMKYYTKFFFFQIEKSQGEIYRLRAKLESTQTENENMQVCSNIIE